MDFHCQPWSLSLVGVIAVLFAPGLASVALQGWDLGPKLQLAVCYLTVAGSLRDHVSYDPFALLTKSLTIADPLHDRLSCYSRDNPKMGENLLLVFSYLLCAGCFATFSVPCCNRWCRSLPITHWSTWKTASLIISVNNV